MSVYRQLLCTAAVCYLCMSMGVIFTWPSSTLTLFKSPNTTLHRPMTEPELALFGSLFSIGALIATPMAAVLLGKLGRKYCTIMFSLTHVVCWTMILASNRVEVLLAAVFIAGTGGAAYVVVPVYITEFCQESIRGAMTSGCKIFYAIGMIISYTIGGYMDYYPMVYTSLTISVVGVIILGLMKESPLFLMMKGREQEAKISVSFFRNAKIDSKIVQQEIATIRRTLSPKLDEPDTPEEELKLKGVQKPEKLSLIKFFKKSYSTRRAMLVALITMTLSLLQGLIVVQVYAQPLFSEAMPTMSATVTSVLLSIVTVLSGFVAAYLTESAGRKPVLIYSSIAAGVCCVLLGSQIHVHWGPHIFTAVFVYLYCVLYTLGAGTIPFVLAAELFLPEVKSFATMVVVEWAWLCNVFILFIFNPLVSAIGLGQVFYLFAGLCFLTALFAHAFVPETRGLPADAIQALFSKKGRHLPTPASINGF